MTDPAKYEVLLRNVFRLVEDAELLLSAGRFASANALALSALREAGKYTALITGREVMGQHFQSATVCEAFANQMESMLEDLKQTKPDAYAEAMSAPRSELIRCAVESIAGEPTFDMDKFIRRVVRNDRSLRSAEQSGRRTQQSIHVEYDVAGELLVNPTAILKEEAGYWVEMARWAAELQKFWLFSWQKHAG